MRDRQQAFRDFERSFQHPGPAASFFDPVPPAFPAVTHPAHHHPVPSLFHSAPPPSVTMLSARDHGGHHSQELSPKARVSYDEGRFQVEFDVQEFRPEELSIKTEGDVLVVLAKHETKTENGGSFVSKQFEQRFTLPSGVKPENITSSLAKDGTLTVSAPRELPKADLTPFKKRTSGDQLLSSSGGGPVGHTGGGGGDVYGRDAANEDQGLPHPKVKYDEDKFQISLDCQHYRPEELDVKVEGNTIIITAKQEVKESGGTRTRVFEQKFTLPSGVKAEKVTSTFGRDGVLFITAPRGNTSAPYSSLEQRMDRVMAPSSWERPPSPPTNKDESSSYTSRRTVRDDHGHGSSLKHGSSLFDPPSSFFTSAPPPSALALGGPGVSGDNGGGGVSRILYDDDQYKILVNVNEFNPEDIIVKTVGDSVHLEAKREEKTSDGHSYSSRNISQSFTLPRGVNPESVTSSLNKDGVLTISAPLPPALRGPQGSERLVPVKHR